MFIPPIAVIASRPPARRFRRPRVSAVVRLAIQLFTLIASIGPARAADRQIARQPQ
jgi:hypothetical protein